MHNKGPPKQVYVDMGCTSIASLFSSGISSIPDSEINTTEYISLISMCLSLPSDLDSSRSSLRPHCVRQLVCGFCFCCVQCVQYMVIGDWWVEQELLEVADQGLHCLAWQSNNIEGENCKDSSAKVTDSRDREGASKNFKVKGNSGEKCGAQEELSENTKVEYSCDEETDHFLDAEVEQDQAQQEQRLPMPEEDEETHKLFKVQPRDTDEDSAKFFIVQPLDDDQQTEQDGVVALMTKKQDTGSSDYEGITDVFRDIEIEDLEAEKENVGGNGTDVEKILRDNSPLMSKIHYRGEHEKLQDTSKVDPCLETYEEIII